MALNSVRFWGTAAIWSRKLARVMSLMSRPATLVLPAVHVRAVGLDGGERKEEEKEDRSGAGG